MRASGGPTDPNLTEGARMRRLGMRRTGALVAAVALAGALAAGPAGAAPAPTVTHYDGTLADGATWIADVPSNWRGVLVLYSHGYGPLVAQDAPDPATHDDLLAEGYALVGSSYSGSSWWALSTAKDDQFAALTAVERRIGHPRETLAFGTSMGGLISAQEAQDSRGRIDGALTTCGLVGGGVNLNNYQLDGEYALARLLLPGQQVQLVDYVDAGQTALAVQQLSTAVQQAQATAAGRARIALAAALLNTPDWISGATPPRDYAEQEAQEAAWLPQQLAFVISARPSIEQAAGGNASWTAGVDYARLVNHSAFHGQIATLYRQAGLSLAADERDLTRHADIEPDLRALWNLSRTSTVTGHLDVPELDLHTISDQLAPIAYENLYGRQVRRAGDARLFRQAYVAAIGHCNFTPAELVAGLHTLQRRVTTGHWPDTSAAALNRAAAATGYGSSAFVRYDPPPFVNARSYWPFGPWPR
jgi:hypothetical protein